MDIFKKFFGTPFRAMERRLDRMDSALIILLERTRKMALDFSRLETEVAENNSVIASAVTLLQSIAQEIRDSAANQAKVVELADRLDTQSNALAAAVAANTTSAPELPAA